MTLEEVKLMDFNREMTDVEINKFVEDMLSLTDKTEFSKIFMHFVDEEFYLDGNTTKATNVNIEKILKDKRLKIRVFEFYDSVDDFAQFDQMDEYRDETENVT